MHLGMLGERKIMISLTNQITSSLPEPLRYCTSNSAIKPINNACEDLRRYFWPTSLIALRHERSVGSISVASIGHAGHRPISACFTPQHRGRKIRSRAAKTVTFYDSFCRILGAGGRVPVLKLNSRRAHAASSRPHPAFSLRGARKTIARKITARKTTASEDVSDLCSSLTC